MLVKFFIVVSLPPDSDVNAHIYFIFVAREPVRAISLLLFQNYYFESTPTAK